MLLQTPIAEDEQDQARRVFPCGDARIARECAEGAVWGNIAAPILTGTLRKQTKQEGDR